MVAILQEMKPIGIGGPVCRTSDPQQDFFFPELWEGQQYLKPLREQRLGSKQG